MEPIANETIRQSLEESLNEWTFSGDKLHREFSFTNFKEAAGFIFRIAFEAEELGHHPELSNTYNKVKISLTSHDAGDKVTEKDLKLAIAIEKIYGSF